MKKKPLITLIIGTRPEAIKLAPLILLLKKSNLVEFRVVLTGQHNEMVSGVNKLFNICANQNLEVMTHGQTLTEITNEVLKGISKEFKKYKPDLVLVQGDTTSAMASALAAFYEKIPIGHVEAGLRTTDIYSPFPEEANRRFISQVAALNFAPTRKSELNLINSNIPGKIFLTGNTVIDALNHILSKAKRPNYKNLNWDKDIVIFATVHRRENWGENLYSIANGLKNILEEIHNAKLIIPLHPNKLVREPLTKVLSNNSKVVLTEPMEYDALVATVKSSTLLLTDSGGLQEEAPSLGVPVLVLRDSTERPEGIEAGVSKLVGSNSNVIAKEAINLLKNKNEYKKIINTKNPYGDGTASKKILNYCLEFFNLL